MGQETNGKRDLRRGYTTGTCAAAAAKGAVLAMMLDVPIHRIGIFLPRGEPIQLPVRLLEQGESASACSVIKDAGDDPDVTNGAEIIARVRKIPLEGKGGEYELSIRGGKGVGRVTKPGLPVDVGGWAINPVPMSMIRTEVLDVLINFERKSRGAGFEVVIEVPEGEELAPRTLNPRLGVIGGISILGTTGIVEPISTRAWEDTVAVQIDVAVACGVRTVVLTPGRSSERVAESLLPVLPEEAFVQMGDFVGSSLRACGKRGVERVVVVAMPGKMSKIALQYENTNYKHSELKLDRLAAWAERLGMSEPDVTAIRKANTVRRIWQVLAGDTPFYSELCRRARDFCERIGGGKFRVETILIGYDGKVLARGAGNRDQGTEIGK